MSDRRAWARKTLVAAAADLGALSGWENNDVYQEALANIRDDPDVEKIVAQFNNKILLTPTFAKGLLPHRAIEMAVGLLMYRTATAMADPACARPVLTKEICEKQAELNRNIAYALSLEPDGEDEERKRDEYVAAHKLLLAIQAPIDDPIVERRRPVHIKTDVSLGDEDRARAVCVRIRDLARRIFGNAGDKVADAFVNAATGAIFSRHDRRRRFKR
jgi:hypothetical protein